MFLYSEPIPEGTIELARTKVSQRLADMMTFFNQALRTLASDEIYTNGPAIGQTWRSAGADIGFHKEDRPALPYIELQQGTTFFALTAARTVAQVVKNSLIGCLNEKPDPNIPQFGDLFSKLAFLRDLAPKE